MPLSFAGNKCFCQGDNGVQKPSQNTDKSPTSAGNKVFVDWVGKLGGGRALRSTERDHKVNTWLFPVGNKVFVGETEEYKNEVASRREAEELAALEAEQASLLKPQAHAHARSYAQVNHSTDENN